MKVSGIRTGSALVLMALTSGVSLAVPPDPRLLSLVPPDSQIIAGAVAPLHEHHRGNFLLFTRANTLDIEDFFSLLGADPSFEIHQVIFAASTGPGGAPPEHSLLAIGHFDTDRLYRRSANATSSAMNYHGIDVIVVPPFERERAFLGHDRLFAIIDARLAIFGTIASVQEEIDRYLTGTPPDASIVRKLGQLRKQNETWCLITSLSLGAEIARVLKSLDPAFGEIDERSNTLLFGITYGREIEFEYEMKAASSEEVLVSLSPTEKSFLPTDGGELTSTFTKAAERGSRRVVKISRARYDKWLADMTPH